MNWATAVALVAVVGAPNHGQTLFGEPAAVELAADERAALAHPAVVLVDADGNPVVRSGRPVSTMRTCGDCHDTDYIARHNYHAAAGIDETAAAGAIAGWRPWDTSPGWFGRWNPMTYRLLTPPGDERFDLGTADWIRLFGDRHPGGGPAAQSRGGVPLADLKATSHIDVETHVLDATTGRATPWGWDGSGAVELDCFVCHLANPDTDARARALRAGSFAWAATATLAATGLVTRRENAWEWDRGMFDEFGRPREAAFTITPPRSAHCGRCHGLAHAGGDPIQPRYGLGEYATETKGEIFSPQRILQSGMNVAGKDTLARPWDVHAERLLECTGCHYSQNDPSYTASEEGTPPRHLEFDGRRQEIGEFLRRPSHQLVKGYSAQSTVANHLDGTMRRCDSCHDAVATHGWLPYTARHMGRLMCESCHVPRVYAPARRVTDWTVLAANGEPRVEYRGTPSTPGDPAALIDGYRPVLLPRVAAGDGALPRLGPHNLIASWYWVSGDPPRPVRRWDLERAFFGHGGAYRAEIVAAFDDDGDGVVESAELVLDAPAKTAAVRTRLQAVGVVAPHIEAELQPFGLHHTIAAGEWATRSCDACHSAASIVTEAFVLASAVPGGVLPELVGDSNVGLGGALLVRGGGELVYAPASMGEGFYVLGHDRRRAVDGAGVAVIVVVALGALAHGGLRYRFATKRAKPAERADDGRNS